MLSGEIVRKRELDNSKGWIYKIADFDISGNELKTIFILDEGKNIDRKVIDEITSINRE